MARNNLRVITDAFMDNVKSGIKANLDFDGKTLRLSTEKRAGFVGLTKDLTDDTAYRIHGEDIDEVASELGVTLTEMEFQQVQHMIGDGFSDSWHDIVEQAIDNVLALRKEG
jgi:hypothetical protein